MPKFVAYRVALVLVCDMAVLGVNYLADETTLITDAPRRFSADAVLQGPVHAA